MTQALNPQGGLLHQLRIIASCALVGTVTAGAILGSFDPEHIETYRQIGAAVGALTALVTGAYRIL